MTAAASSNSSPTGPVPFPISFAAASGTILQPLNSSMIAVAIVGVAAQFGSNSGVSWIISAMYITTAVGAPMAGRLGIPFGARRVFLAGLFLVAAGSLMGVLAPSIGWLIAAYVILGMGISAHMPNAMTMVRSYAERFNLQPRTAITTLVVCSQSVAALGPTVGGLLVGAFGWQSILWVNLPVVAISALMVLRVDVPNVRGGKLGVRQTVQTLDGAGILLFLLSLTSTMFFLVSFRSAPVWWLLPAAAAGLAMFVIWERRAPELHRCSCASQESCVERYIGQNLDNIHVLLLHILWYSSMVAILAWNEPDRGWIDNASSGGCRGHCNHGRISYIPQVRSAPHPQHRYVRAITGRTPDCVRRKEHSAHSCAYLGRCRPGYTQWI